MDKKMTGRCEAETLKNAILSSLYGGIVGDILGVPVEFKKRGTYTITDVIGYGTYNQPPGTWSDDTSLTLCLVENLIENNGPDELMKKFVQYRESGYWTPYDEMFDIGISTSEAISRFKKGTPAQACGGNSMYDNGNGALMRIAPVAFVINDQMDFNEKIQIIKAYTEITHGHARSVAGSVIYVELLRKLCSNLSLTESLRQVKDLFEKNFAEDHMYRKELQAYSRMFKDDFFALPKEEILSTGYVVHTLEAAVWCLGNSNSFSEAVLMAVNLGDDTDTVGAVTGTLAGMYYHMEQIPQPWLDKIARKKEIDDLLNQFLHTAMEGA